MLEAKLTAFSTAVDELSARTENEAETRHKIIDLAIHDILSWPRNRVSYEEYIHPGYADYILKKENGDPILFIEAKRAGQYFTLPVPHAVDETSCYVSIRSLRTDTNIRDAMDQVRTYCMDTGCEFACITNGHEWIWFKTFERNRRWDTLQAFVIRNKNFFTFETTRAINSFSFIAVTEHSSLIGILTSSYPKDKTIYFAKERISSYGHTINSNRLASSLRPIVNQYFGVIADDDTEFMDRCYVSQRDYTQTFDGVRSIIQDRLTPYFENYRVEQLEDSGHGGRLGGKLKARNRTRKAGEVLVLFGGKGAGKSTFIKRLLHHKVPPRLRNHSIVAIIDLLTIPEDSSAIHRAIWEGLISSLDRDNLLSGFRSELLSGVFSDRFELALRQELAGLPSASEGYNVRLNALISSWKADLPYCATRLVDYWKDKGKGIIVVIDNTDQYSGRNQDFCFATAKEISSKLGCITLISMREERFFESKVHGVLDAFQNSGFHISSPKPAEVFIKRLDYTIAQLRKQNKNFPSSELTDNCKYLEILSNSFRNENSPLNSFLSACAHGDTRLSLDLFRSFVLSGYTNVEEMIESGSWTFQIHQIIKPVMIPTRFFYDERLSDIPNIYQVRHNRNGSHFTALRILRKLSKNVQVGVAGYLAISSLKAYFNDTFNMLDDFNLNIDMLLKRGFIEANNRIDYYSEHLDSLKITGYGLYMLDYLSNFFAYIDLICIDCGIFDQETSNYMMIAANREYNLFQRQERVERVRVRLDRAEHFIRYLCCQEEREREEYNLGMPLNELFTHKALGMFLEEKSRVETSAVRTGGRQGRRPS